MTGLFCGWTQLSRARIAALNFFSGSLFTHVNASPEKNLPCTSNSTELLEMAGGVLGCCDGNCFVVSAMRKNIREQRGQSKNSLILKDGAHVWFRQFF